MRRRVEVTVEVERITIGQGNVLVNQWCSLCDATVAFAQPDHAAVACNVSTRAIYRWIEQGRVHFIDSAPGLVVCLPSLVENVER